jgi:hypothetical protein
LRSPSDVRWLDSSHLLVTDALQGAYRVSLADGVELGKMEVRKGNGRGEFFLPVYIAASEQFLAVASPVHVIGWRRWSEPELHQSAFSAVLDIDLQQDRLLILGAQIDDSGMAPDGAIAYTGSIAGDSLSLRPLHYSATGPGARAVNACGLMDISAARFMRDGSAILVPGAEPGVFQYNPKGRLVKSWQSEQIGFDAGCDLTEEEMYRYSMDQVARWNWVNRRRIVDDVLPLSDGAGLLVRSVKDGTAHWELKVLRENGIRTCKIPMEGSSDFYLHGDADGHRIVFLLFPKPKQNGQEPAARPKLIVMKYQP